MPASPTGGEAGEGSRLPAAPSRLLVCLRAGWGLGQGHPRSRVHSSALGWRFPSLLCLSCPQTRQARPCSAQLGGDRRPKLPMDSGQGSAWSVAGAQRHGTDPDSPRGRETAANQDASPERGGWDVLEPALAALAAGSGSVLPHPRALGHNDQVSQHQVRGPTLPCLPAHGKSLSPGRKAIPDAACLPVPHQSSHPAAGRWLEPGPACTNTDPLPPPRHVRTHTRSVPR